MIGWGPKAHMAYHHNPVTMTTSYNGGNIEGQ